MTGDGNGAKCNPETHQLNPQDDARVQFTDTCNADVGSTSASRCSGRLPVIAANTAATVLAVIIAWTLLYVNVSPELMAVPGGSLASIFMLYVTGTVAGQLITKVGGLPPLLGMMLAGIALRNSGLYNVTGWCFQLVSTMREAALTVILIKGGLELNAGQLRRLSGVVARLTVLPCVAEAVAAGVAAHFILPDFSLVWGLTLGFTLSAVSPAVLVPSLFRLKRLGYGEVKGINTLLIAASSLDDAVSISAFGILLGVLFSTGSLTSKIIQGPIDVSIGTVMGLIWGCVLVFVPPSPWSVMYSKRESNRQNTKKSEIENSVTAKRSFLLGTGGFLAVTGSQWCGYPGAGPLACIISAFVAGTGWRKQSAQHKQNNSVISAEGVDGGGEDIEDDELPVVQVFEHAWTGLQPVLFAFIGTDLKFELLKRGDIFLELLVLAFGLIVRLIITTCSVIGTGFSRKEVLFVNIAWLPKATVQAALAPVALDIARNFGTLEDVECATRLVTIAVVSILLTAPMGAFGIQLFGPRLLPKEGSREMRGDENNGGGGDGGSSAAQPPLAGLQPLKRYNAATNSAYAADGRPSIRSSSLLARSDHRWPATAADAIAVLLSVAVAWCLLRVNVTPSLMAVPGGSVASMFMLYVAGLAAGHAVDAAGGLPPLLGMMLAGIALQNFGLYTVTAPWCVHLVAIMREAALSVILIKGGLEMNAAQLRRLSGAVTRLALLPCVAEAAAAAVAAYYILPNFSWEWGLMLGFVLSAVSPAVLVPNLLRLKHMGYGEKNGVNTLVIAASSLDDIVSISAFGVLSGIIFSTGDLTSKIVQGPEDVCIGTALGLVWGFLLIFVPPAPWANVSYTTRKGSLQNNDQNREKQAEKSVTAKRAFLLGSGGFLAVTGSQWYGYPGAGPLACIISSFVAGTGWKWREEKQNCNRPTIVLSHDDVQDGTHNKSNPVEAVFECIWFGLQPILFASIGTEVKFELLKGGDIVIAGLLVLVCGLIVRLIVTSCAVWGAGLNFKEVIFINIAWLPKATVQAALAPVALEMARMMGTDEDLESASRLLTISVISILVTAPIGAFGIQWFGPRLLSHSGAH